MRIPINTRLCVLAWLMLLALQPAHAFYDPGTQRWLNRDPIEEKGGVNLYVVDGNDPNDFVDSWGTDIEGGIIVQPRDPPLPPGYPNVPPSSPTQPTIPPIQIPPGQGAGGIGGSGRSGNWGAGNAQVCHAINPCTEGQYGSVERFKKACPNGTSVSCTKWKRCEAYGNLPSAGSGSNHKPATKWVEYERCPPCPAR